MLVNTIPDKETQSHLADLSELTVDSLKGFLPSALLIRSSGFVVEGVAIDVPLFTLRGAAIDLLLHRRRFREGTAKLFAFIHGSSL